jgi:hypothetical protein
MRRSIIFSLLQLVLITVVAQVNFPVVKNNLMYDKLEKCSDGLLRFQKNNKWGYLNKNGIEVIVAKFEDARDFNNGFAAAKQGDSWGLIDKKGNWKIQPKYFDLGYTFRYNQIQFIEKTSRNYGIININGETVLPADYYTVRIAAKFLVPSKRKGFSSNYDYFLFNSKGTKLIPEACDLVIEDSIADFAAVKRGKKWTIIDASGKILQDSLKDAEVKAVGLNLIVLKQLSTNKYGICDKQGKMIVDFDSYTNISLDNDGFLLVTETKTAWGSTNSLYGLLDKTGKVILPAKYSYMGGPANGMILLKDTEAKKYGYADFAGKIVIPFKYTDANHFQSSGLAVVRLENSSTSVAINKKGIEVDKTKTNFPTFNEGVAVEKNDPYFLLIDKKKTQKKIEGYTDQWNIKDGMFKVQDKNKKYGFMDLTGKLVIPCNYDDAGFFSEGMVWVAKKGPYSYSPTNYGYINKQGEEILPGELTKVNDFKDGFALVVDKNKQQFFINKKGQKQTLPRTYDEVNGFNDGYALCKVNAKTKSENPTWYFIDVNFKEVKSITRYVVPHFSNGYTFVYTGNGVDYEILDKNFAVAGKIKFRGIDSVFYASDELYAFKDSVLKKWGYKNIKGETIIQPQFERGGRFVNGLLVVEKNGKYGFVDKTGKWVVEPIYDDVNPFYEDGFARAKKDGKYGLIDKTGKVWLEIQHNRLTDFQEGFTVLKIDNSYRIVKL